AAAGLPAPGRSGRRPRGHAVLLRRRHREALPPDPRGPAHPVQLDRPRPRRVRAARLREVGRTMDEPNGIKQALYRFWAWSMQTNERISPRTKDRIVKAITQGHVAYLRRNPPSAASSLAAPTLLMTVRGRKTGKLRTMPAFYMPDGERWVIVGSYGGDHRHPQWYHNLMAAGEAAIEIDGRRHEVSAALASPE